jgi:hypothetical protein
VEITGETRVQGVTSIADIFDNNVRHTLVSPIGLATLSDPFNKKG